MTFDAGFISSVLSIVLIDITLAGDNAVVIAMAARTLPAERRRAAILLGALAAVVVRVLFTFFVAQLLGVQFVKLVGGIVILWVAMKLFVADGAEVHPDRAASNTWQAIKLIVIADISMGIDNMLAVGGASGGNLGLLLFGLGLSIPFVVFASNFLSRLMDRYPVILYFGAAILGRVSGDMIMTDPTTTALLHPSRTLVHLVEATLALGVVLVGWWWRRRAARRAVAEVVAEQRAT